MLCGRILPSVQVREALMTRCRPGPPAHPPPAVGRPGGRTFAGRARRAPHGLATGNCTSHLIPTCAGRGTSWRRRGLPGLGMYSKRGRRARLQPRARRASEPLWRQVRLIQLGPVGCGRGSGDRWPGPGRRRRSRAILHLPRQRLAAAGSLIVVPPPPGRPPSGSNLRQPAERAPAARAGGCRGHRWECGPGPAAT